LTSLHYNRLQPSLKEDEMIATTETNLREMKLPRLLTQLPGPKAKQVLEQDNRFMSPSFTRDYPLVAKRGRGAMVEDVDGNTFLDFAAGIAVCSPAIAIPKSSKPFRNKPPS
jgi:4-aminobutyrate aminotransferase